MDEKKQAAAMAQRLEAAYSAYRKRFTQLTEESYQLFHKRDFSSMHNVAVRRLSLYSKHIKKLLDDDRLSGAIKGLSADAVTLLRVAFAEQICSRPDRELAATFYNSLMRRLFMVVGVDERIEFCSQDFDQIAVEQRECPVCQVYQPSAANQKLQQVVESVLGFYAHQFDFRDLGYDVARCTQALQTRFDRSGAEVRIDLAEFLTALFVLNRLAYIIGRLTVGEKILPLVFVLQNTPTGVVVDALIDTEDEVSVLFSFTRSYFHTQVENPTETINFLKTIMPKKKISELYTSLGFHKHGKSELYREITRHMATSEERFDFTTGAPGMVMLVFTLPSLDVVFKVIKDRFDSPKNITPADVRDRYQLVFQHDRAGRLVDAQEFEHLEFDKRRFSKKLLDALCTQASHRVLVRDQRVILRHLYTERRVVPLDVYLKTQDTDRALAAVVDYGMAIKELAATNIFCGDLFPKNFGVTRHGRVVFYDYDELCLLTDCNFRRLPEPLDDVDEFAAEPWFAVAPNDIFPEEFKSFVVFPKHLQSAFESVHSDLFSVQCWRGFQDVHNRGERIDILPYKAERRLPR